MKNIFTFSAFLLASAGLFAAGPMEKPEFNALIKATEGTKTVSKQTIETDQDGLNAVFARGNKTVIDISNVKINTKQNGSRGLYAAFGGTINAKNVEVTTQGEHCASFATDMGGGTVTVENGRAETFGRGSPVLYCTGNISAKNLTGKANASEIAVIEGKNTLSIENSALTGGAGLDGEVQAGIMIYQSMSGDAESGTAVLNIKNSSLTNTSGGPFFYATNTKGTVNLCNVKLTNKSGVLFLISGNDSNRGWGRRGANGAQIELNAEKQNLEGEIQTDNISSLKMNLKDKSVFTGSADKAKNGTVSISISNRSKIILTADSYFNAFTDADESFKNVKSNGHNIFYNKDNSQNSYLHGRTIILSDGGKLVPFEYEYVKVTESADDFENRPPFPPEQNGNNPPPDMDRANHKMETRTGTLQVVKSTAMLIESDDRAVVLKLMEENRKEPPKNSGNSGFSFDINGTPPEDMGSSMNKPVAPPHGNMGQPPEMGQGQPGRKGQKSVTISDLKKLSGKTVEVKGVMESDGKFMLFEISEKK